MICLPKKIAFSTINLLNYFCCRDLSTCVKWVSSGDFGHPSGLKSSFGRSDARTELKVGRKSATQDTLAGLLYDTGAIATLSQTPAYRPLDGVTSRHKRS